MIAAAPRMHAAMMMNVMIACLMFSSMFDVRPMWGGACGGDAETSLSDRKRTLTAALSSYLHPKQTCIIATYDRTSQSWPGRDVAVRRQREQRWSARRLPRGCAPHQPRTYRNHGVSADGNESRRGREYRRHEAPGRRRYISARPLR